MALVDNLIYMITPSASSVDAGAVLPLTTIARKKGKVLLANGNSVLLGESGYYKVTVTTTFTAPAAGDVEIKLQKNSADVAGIVASTTITTADTEVRSITLSGIVRVLFCEGIATLTLLNSGIAIDTTNISFDIVYLGN